MKIFIRYCGQEIYAFVKPEDEARQTVKDAIKLRCHGQRQVSSVKYCEVEVKHKVTFEQLGVYDLDMFYGSPHQIPVGDSDGSNIRLYKGPSRDDQIDARMYGYDPEDYW